MEVLSRGFMIRLIFRISLALMVVIVGRTEVHGELEPVAEFRLIRPDVLATRVNQLFAGTKTPHPASALSAWKRATRGIGSLGKPLEAVISFFNPEMAREWGLFDGTTLKF